MLAYMDHTMQNVTEKPRGFFAMWRLDRDLTIVVGAAIGTLGLMFILAFAVLAWRCCCQKSVNEKEYGCKKQPEECKIVAKRRSGIIQSDSVVLVDAANNQQYETQVLEINNKSMLRSQSVPIRDGKGVKESHKSSSMKPRPLSQPVHLCYQAPPYPHATCSNPSELDLTDAGVDVNQVILSSIPENNSQSHYDLQDMPTLSECPSYDELVDLNGLPCQYIINPDVKTRSLPAWGHSRLRPLSTEDDLNELYAKVNFSKKRKNRMRNDSAAAIAVNKSQNSFITLPFVHKDTDSLVDNEAIVIYDERTAL
ncbi:uncharacterized protein LOC106474451 [Limulus polyphemus]|uniref:Uncharacterized protein LOC106474451 n=1 Tax=Limulus polyphemus TaxID=6850 RepID=A0ABM1BXL3_LIMPO|nr:uncharacterized protein LOC106474451 [Limulus polyphemus]